MGWMAGWMTGGSSSSRRRSSHSQGCFAIASKASAFIVVDRSLVPDEGFANDAVGAHVVTDAERALEPVPPTPAVARVAQPRHLLDSRVAGALYTQAEAQQLSPPHRDVAQRVPNGTAHHVAGPPPLGGRLRQPAAHRGGKPRRLA